MSLFTIKRSKSPSKVHYSQYILTEPKDKGRKAIKKLKQFKAKP